jgi:hypothetical protein
VVLRFFAKFLDTGSESAEQNLPDSRAQKKTAPS